MHVRRWTFLVNVQMYMYKCTLLVLNCSDMCVGSSGHVLGYGDGAAPAVSSRGTLQSTAANSDRDKPLLQGSHRNDDIADVENELMEIEESEQDRESIEGHMSQSDDSDSGSDEDDQNAPGNHNHPLFPLHQ